MDPLETLLAERACERLTHRYCRYADGGQASRLGELFTQDGVFSIPGMTLRGRAEIAARFAGREALVDLRTLHLCSNLDVEVTGPSTAHGWVNLCLFRRWQQVGDPGPVPVTVPSLVASYEDVYERVGEQWLIASRVQHAGFADPSDTGWERPADR